MSTTQTQTATGRRYQSITEAEFDAFMNEIAVYEKTVPANAKEVAYDIPLPVDGLVVRVWSTIVRGNSRACGNDAIRTVVWDTERSEPISGRKKTLRLAPTKSNSEGWKGNLRPKITDLIRQWRRYDKQCSECGNRMALRQPSRGDEWSTFWSCTDYPRCQHSEPHEE
jgi:hypothetical protein